MKRARHQGKKEVKNIKALQKSGTKLRYTLPKFMVTPTDDKILQVAQYFLKKSQENPEMGLDSLKLQKLLYYAKAWNLVLNKGDELFVDDFQAWIHGPANFKVWDTFKTFNFSTIYPEVEELKLALISSEEKNILEMVWSVYGKFDGKYLESLTHNEEPWIKARKDLSQDMPSQNIISSESILSYYGQRFKEEAGA